MERSAMMLPDGFQSALPITFPCMAPRLVPSAQVVPNDYNPNGVAAPEMDLLEHSIRCDGVTQAIVVVYDDASNQYIIVDGFHRYLVLTQVFGLDMIPVVVLDASSGACMVATYRHDQARGAHQVVLMASLVEMLLRKGYTDEQMATELGMEQEEIIRLKGMRKR